MMRESQPWTDLPYEREPAMDRSTLGERASHGQIYLMREPWTDLLYERSQMGRSTLGERVSHGQIYLMRESQPQDRST